MCYLALWTQVLLYEDVLLLIHQNTVVIMVRHLPK